MSMTDPATAMHHSPALWGLLGAGAAAGVLLVGTVGWNVWQHFHDNGVTVGAGLRSALRF
jgi:hypothetical protein